MGHDGGTRRAAQGAVGGSLLGAAWPRVSVIRRGEANISTPGQSRTPKRSHTLRVSVRVGLHTLVCTYAQVPRRPDSVGTLLVLITASS